MSTSEAMWWLAQLQVWVVQKSCFDNKCSTDNIRICFEYSEALKYAVYDALNYMESLYKGAAEDITSYTPYAIKNEELHNRLAEYDEKLYKEFLGLYEQWTQTLFPENRRHYLISKECIDICDPKRE